MARPHLCRSTVALLLLTATLIACGGGDQPTPPASSTPPATPPSLLLVTLDTTRADAVAPTAAADVTPSLAGLATRGIVFTQAYSTAPSTLPAHASMMTGLYPAGHGLHENGRRLSDALPVLAEELRSHGYATAAFVSGYPLERQTGMARGFDVYDDAFGEGRVERSAEATTGAALAHLGAVGGAKPVFLWVHYYDPHEPYAPPEPFRSRFPKDPYQGEVAAMDHSLGRLIDAFSSRPDHRVLVVADHGEGRGDHGEQLHGNLLYQGVMHVPLYIAGTGNAAGRREDAVSSRQVRATFLEWAGDVSSAGASLLRPAAGPVLGEAMQPFLSYRWQPQVMAVAQGIKLIRSGRLELYDLAADPGETNDLAALQEPNRGLARALADYPLPSPKTALAASSANSDEERKKLASLGYVASESVPDAVPADAPRAAEMTHLFAELDAASHRFVAEDYRAAIPLFQRILREDPGNLMAAVRLAVCFSLLGRDAEALANFDRARKIDPASLDARHYLAMHLLQTRRFDDAAAHFEAVLGQQPDRGPALEALAKVRTLQGRPGEAADLLERALPLTSDAGGLQVRLGLLRMELGDTAGATAAFESARAAQGAAFRHDLELGVLYMASQRFDEARQALDRVAEDHPERAMALYKRAQLSVLLQEGDRNERVRQALAGADATTRELIQGDPLFAGLPPP
jgi:choline-sulfatase